MVFSHANWGHCLVNQFEMRHETPCKVACRMKLNAEAAKNFKEKIDDEYRVNMYVLPMGFSFLNTLIDALNENRSLLS